MQSGLGTLMTFAVLNHNSKYKKMNHQSPEIGTYQVVRAYNELFNGTQMPVAEVFFKKESSIEWGSEPIVIRFRALYYQRSNGPKEQFTIDRLSDQYLRILAMHTHIDVLNPTLKTYSIDWDIDDPEPSAIVNDKLISNDTEQIDEIDDPEFLKSEEFTAFIEGFNKRRF